MYILAHVIAPSFIIFWAWLEFPEFGTSGGDKTTVDEILPRNQILIPRRPIENTMSLVDTNSKRDHAKSQRMKSHRIMTLGTILEEPDGLSEVVVI